MAIRRRRKPSPYEVLSSRQIKARREEVVESRADGEEQGGTEFQEAVEDYGDYGDGLMARARAPMVIRIPTGFVILLAVLAIALICLAYGVGFSRGAKVTADRLTEQLEPQMLPDVGPWTADLTEDTRQQGLFYLVLATYPEQEARELAAFLARNGVETMLLSRDNDQFLVVARRGFTTEQRFSENVESAFTDYKRRLQQLGRIWKSQNNGPTDLSTMNAHEYDGTW